MTTQSFFRASSLSVLILTGLFVSCSRDDPEQSGPPASSGIPDAVDRGPEAGGGSDREPHSGDAPSRKRPRRIPAGPSPSPPLEDPRSLDELLEVISSGNLPARVSALQALPSKDGAAARGIPVLVDMVKSTRPLDRATRPMIVHALGKFGDDAKTLVPLLESLLKDPESQVRKQAVTALGNYGREASSALPVLLEMLKDDLVADVLADAIDKVAEDPVPLLMERLGDKSFWVRKTAAKFLVRYSERTLPILERQLRSKDARIRRGAATALRRMKEKARELAPRLVDLLDDPDAEVPVEAAWALADVKPVSKEAIPSLTRNFRAGQPRPVRLSAAYAFNRMGAAAAPAAADLAEWLEDGTPGEARFSVHGALVQIGELAVPHLRKLAASDKQGVRETARRLLSQIEERQ